MLDIGTSDRSVLLTVPTVLFKHICVASVIQSLWPTILVQ